MKARRMTFIPGDGKVSLINLFPSMPLGSCAQTLNFKGAAVHASYLFPEPLCRGPTSSSVSRAWRWRARATSVFSIGPTVMPIHKASLPLGHLQTSSGPHNHQMREKNNRGGVLATDTRHVRGPTLSPASSLSSEMLRGCSLSPPLTCLWLSDAVGASGRWLVQWQLRTGFCYSLVCFLCH